MHGWGCFFFRKYAFNNRLSNLGYAFVNFTSARAAFRFFQQFHGQKWVGDEDWKVCEVAKAVVQVGYQMGSLCLGLDCMRLLNILNAFYLCFYAGKNVVEEKV